MKVRQERLQISPQHGDFPLVVAGARAGGIPEDYHPLGNGRNLVYLRHGLLRIILNSEIRLPVVGLLDQHLRPLGLRQGDHQVLDRRPILLLGLGDVAVAPLLEGKVGQLALGHLRRGRRLDHLDAERKLPDLALELQGQVIGRGLAAAGQLGDVLDADRAGAVGRDGKHAGLKIVARRPLHQSGVDPLADDRLVDLPGLVLLDRHAVDHHAVDIQGIAADRGALGQGEVEVAFQDPARRVGEGHGRGRFGHGAEDADLGPHRGQPQGRRDAIGLDHQGRGDRLGGECRGKHEHQEKRGVGLHGKEPFF